MLSAFDVLFVKDGTVLAADLKAVSFGNQVQFVEKDGKVVLLFKAERK